MSSILACPAWHAESRRRMGLVFMVATCGPVVGVARSSRFSTSTRCSTASCSWQVVLRRYPTTSSRTRFVFSHVRLHCQVQLSNECFHKYQYFIRCSFLRSSSHTTVCTIAPCATSWLSGFYEPTSTFHIPPRKLGMALMVSPCTRNSSNCDIGML